MSTGIRRLELNEIDRTIHTVRTLPGYAMPAFSESLEVWGRVEDGQLYTAIAGHRRYYALEHAGEPQVSATTRSRCRCGARKNESVRRVSLMA